MATAGSASLLPPLNALRVFEVAGRLGSFKRAAEVLHVTPGAVSRQVALLEEHLRLPLFERHHREVALTAQGRAYLADIVLALEQVRGATERLRRPPGQRPLAIWCPMTFSLRWLAPRLPQFQRLHPQREVSITTVLSPLEVDLERFDVAIRIGRGQWPGLRSRRLVGIELTPVCSPALLKGRPGRAGRMSLDELRRQTLLHSAARPDYWRLWLQDAGATGVDPERGMRLESVGLAWELAMQGAGIAMGQMALVEADLAAGRLVAPFSHVAPIDDAFYLIESPAAGQDPMARELVDWIFREAEVAESRRLMPAGRHRAAKPDTSRSR